MSLYQDYLKAKKELESDTLAPVQTNQSSLYDDYLRAKKEISSETSQSKVGDIAPVYTNVTNRMTVGKDQGEEKGKKKWYQDWFQKGAMEDDSSWKNVFKTILGSTSDFAEDFTSGIVGMGEKALDGLLTIAPYAYKATVNQDGGIMSPKQQKMVDDIVADSQKYIGEFVKKDLYDEKAIAKQILSNVYAGFEIAVKTQNGGQVTQEDLKRQQESKKQALDYMNTSMESDSVFAERSDSLIQSAGQMAAQKGLTLVGVPWFLTTGLTSAGGQMEQALDEGATYDQAAGSAAITAGGEILGEKLFGGDFFVDDAAADMVTPYLATAISNKTFRALAKFGIDIGGEGFEEAFSDIVSNLGTALYKEENLAEILFSEEAIDGYVESFVGGMVLGGAMNTVNAVQSKSQGLDFTTGLPKELDSAVDSIYDSLISQLEHQRKVSPKEKRQIYAKILEAFTDPGSDTNTQPVEEAPVSEPEIEPVVEEVQPIAEEIQPVAEKQETQPESEVPYTFPEAKAPVAEAKAPTVSKKETVDTRSTEAQIADTEKLLENLYAKRQAIQDEIMNAPDEGMRSELFRQHEHEQYYLRSEILKAEEKLDSLKNPSTQVENSDVAPVVTDEDVARFSEDTANIVSQMVSEDSQAGEKTVSEPQKVYSINGYTIRRVVQKNGSGGERYLINVVSPDGLYRLLHTEKDINSFYGAVSDALGQLMAEEYSVNGTLHTDEAPLKEAAVQESLITDEAPVAEEISAPEVAVSETETTTDSEIQRLQDERQVLQDTIMSRVEVGQVDDTTEMLAKKWNATDSKIRAAEAAKADSSPKTEKAPTLKEKIQQKDRKTNFSFKKLFKEDTRSNRDRYNDVLDGTKKAQDVISNGADGVKSVSDIFGQVKYTDLGDFNLYLYHYLNIDRTTLESRFGKENRPVFGEEGKDSEGNRYIKSYVPASQSQKIVDDLEAKHPEFKAVAEDVYAYCDYILRVRLESGDISQETYDRFRELYPHYVPISRTRHDKQVSDDLVKFLNERDSAIFDGELDDFVTNVRFASAIFSPRRVGDDLRLAMDAMVDQTYRAFWGASLASPTVDADAQPDIAPAVSETEDVPVAEAPVEEEIAPVEEEVAPVEELASEAPVSEEVAPVETASPVAETPVVENAEAFEEAPIVETASPVAESTTVEAPVAEDSAPITETVTDEAPIAESTATPEAAPVEESTPVTPQPSKPSAKSLLDMVESHTKSEPKKKTAGQKVLNAVHAVQEFVADKGSAFERLAKKTNNRQLEADWDYIRRSPSIAQHIISHGSDADGVRSLTAIHEQVKKGKMEQDFSDYLGHLRNLDGMTQYSRYGITNRSFMGRQDSVAKSSEEIARLESAHPEFKQLAEDVYAYNQYLIKQMAEHGVITQEDVDMWNEMYPHYVPMRTANGKEVPVLESMAQFTQQVQYAIAMNDFGRNLKNTLDPDTDHTVEDMDITSFFNGLDAGGNMFNLTGGENPTFSIYEDGYVSTFNITEDMYIALKPTATLLTWNVPLVKGANDLRRNLITAYSPWFTLKNAVKDAQEIMINSQHPLETYATIKTAISEIYSEGDWYREYMENGGGSDYNFDMKSSEFGDGKGVKAFVENKTPLKYILKANNMVEMVPRLAEYIASREDGRSVQVSMLDAARVTTNFAAGGDLTKFLNRNGATFLNASVQGAVQHARNLREAYHAGAKGWASLAARYVAANIPAILLNGLIWDDDEDYQALPDYISNNYYVVWKYGDGKFLRIPKGRTNAVMQYAMEQVMNASTGDYEADWDELLRLFAENIAPNNPVTDHMFAPIGQVKRNETWYGEDIVPTRLQDEPVEEQFDEKTDEWSIKIGQWLGVSPKKVNYLLDQYGGVLGDTFLPMGTPKAESPIDDPAMKLFAPLRDIFTTDSVLNNKVTGEFYDTLEAAEAQAKSEGATMEDKFKSGLMIGYNVEISNLMKKQREIQTSDLSDSEKYIQNREIKEKINELQEEGLKALEDYSIDGNYAESGGKRYNYDSKKDTWWEVKPKTKNGDDNWHYIQEQLFHDKLGVDYADYWNGRLNPEDYDVKSLYGEYGGKRFNFDMKENSWFEIKPTTKDGDYNWYYQQEQTAHNDLGVSYEDFWNNRDAYSDAIYVASNGVDYGWGTPYYETAKKAIGVKKFAEIAGAMADISGENRKQDMKNYIYGLDIPDAQKHILFKAEYPKTNNHNYEIIDYLNEREDISYEQMESILKELGFKVDSNGHITW